MVDKLKIGTRASKLAVAQTKLVIEELKMSSPQIETEIIKIKTSGDRIKDRSLKKIGGKGLFVKEIEKALLSSQIDLAVHSAKDLPRLSGEGLEIAAFVRRGDPRDALVSSSGLKFFELPAGARIATGSARRRSELLNCRSDIEVLDIRGNVDSRLKKLKRGGFDALVLAVAGLDRLGRAEVISNYFSVEQMVPSPGQGALALQVRRNDQITKKYLREINHEETELAVRLEKEFVFELDVNCSHPVGIYARVENNRLAVDSVYYPPSGREAIRLEKKIDLNRSESAGVRLARELREIINNRENH